MKLSLITLLFATAQAVVGMKYLMYLNGNHDVVPEPGLVSQITHVALAFMSPAIFNEAEEPTTWPLFTTVEETRSKFPLPVKVIIAIGGWGDTAGFSVAAASAGSRTRFAKNIKAMLEATGADGLDIDWEYPGGNGEDYKTNPNWTKTWEIEAYPKLLAAIRSSIGPNKLITAAVPGVPTDMMAFNKTSMPKINDVVDFFNVMTYDMMSRRDHVTKHHTGIHQSLLAVNTYRDNGMPIQKMNLGFPFYIRWFRTDPNGGCDINPVGCRTVLMEDPDTGAGLGQAGAFAWSQTPPEKVKASFNRAMENAAYDTKYGGQYYWDSIDNIWWTWESPFSLKKKLSEILVARDFGGVFAWALGEDSPRFEHLKALNEGYRECLGQENKMENNDEL